MKIVATLAGIILLSACSAEWLPVSGGALEGETVPAPENWSIVAAEEIIQFETRPADPYSVNLWVIEMGGDLYVHAGANRATWVEHIEADPAVRLGHEGRIWALTAARVTDADEFARFAAGWEAKYGSEPRNMNVAEAYLYRLTPRS